MPFDGRGRYERPHCPVHGKGHRYPEYVGTFHARMPDGRVRTVRARRCKCGAIKMDVNAIVSRKRYESWNDIPFDELPEQITFPDVEEDK